MHSRGLAGACAVLVAALAATGCGTTGLSEAGSGDTGTGKKLFMEKCASCHALADAGSRATIGPNLDDAFRQSRADGLGDTTIRSVVRGQISYPVEEPPTGTAGMPADLVTGDDAESVAAYVASVAALPVRPQPGEATGGEAEGGEAEGGEAEGGEAGGGAEPDGEAIFASAGCGGCHVLAAARASGNVGPSLDASKPSKELVVDRVTHGKGAMPSFKGSYSADEIAAVADYVATNAGK
jgi:mono/diheme cytochrome c family protein